MLWHGFSRTLLFGMLAAAGWPAMGLLLSGLLGPNESLSLYLVGLAAVYVAGLGNSPRRALGQGLLAIALGAGVLLLAPSSIAAAAGAAAIVGLGRARLFSASRPARTLALELMTLGGGLLLARFLAAPTVLHVCLAIWAFFLAQSLYFLAPDLRKAPEETGLDPFDAAAARAEALLQEVP